MTQTLSVALVQQHLFPVAAERDQQLRIGDQREGFAGTAVEDAEDLGMAGFPLAFEQRQVRRVELLAGL